MRRSKMLNTIFIDINFFSLKKKLKMQQRLMQVKFLGVVKYIHLQAAVGLCMIKRYLLALITPPSATRTTTSRLTRADTASTKNGINICSFMIVRT